jgi:aminobenzoyl-glutamate transport protein
MRQNKQKSFDRYLTIIEKVGNALPHPATLFLLFAVLVLILSWVTSLLDISAVMPALPGKDPVTIRPVNLLSREGLHLILTRMVSNFTGFAPLGVVLVAMLGIGVAESSGLIGAVLRLMVLSTPKKLLTFTIVFAGILSNTASEVGYVLLIPLAAIIFISVGRHPVAGMAAAFAGVSGGYSANLLLGTIDPLLAGLSQEAARIISPDYMVNPAANYYFMFASSFFIAIAGTWVTEKIVVPRLGPYKGETGETVGAITPDEKRGLNFALVAFLLVAALLVWGTVPSTGFLRNPDTGSLLHSPFMDGIISIVFLSAAICGIAYGIGSRKIKNDSHVMNGMGKAMETLGVYIVLVFFAAQFVEYFKWTNLGLIFAIKGAHFLQAMGLSTIPLMLSFILLTAFINLFMGSASAKWTIMAPVFIPMFMLIGISPEMTQVVYRIGDSVTNIISPMMSYFALIVAFLQRYEPKAGIGTIIATMLPYSLVFFVLWSLLLVIWILFGFPLGPDAPLQYHGGL